MKTKLNRFLPASSCVVLGASMLSISGCSSPEDDLRTRSESLILGDSVFINELHYDNEGTDSGESIELVGPAGTDLSQYSVVLYNGANGLVYDTRVLSGVLNDAGSGFGFATLSYAVNGIQNGAPDGIALVRGSEVIEFLSYEGAFTAVDGPAVGLLATDIAVAESGTTPVGFSVQRIGSGSSVLDFTWSAPSASSFGAQNLNQSFESDSGSGGSGSGGEGSGGESSGGAPAGGASGCGAPSTPIATVQGTSAASPFVGQTASVEGIVVGDFQGSGENLGGFFLQSEMPDGDPTTSEGLFIFDQNLSGAPDVVLGERVRVSGVVSEYFGLTELTPTSIEICGSAALPSPTDIAFPLASPTFLESLEGMLVRVGELTVTETYSLGRYGEVSLASGGRLFNPTNGTGTTAATNLLNRILLDDGRDAQNLSVPYLGTDDILRIGDTSNSFEAVLSYGFDAYRLEPLDRDLVSFIHTNPRPESPPEVGGDVRIASLNVLNYFTTLNDRGADTAAEFSRQQQKLVSAIVGLDADVLGLMEIENNDTSGAPVALDDLVEAVNVALGETVYARAPDPSFTGTDRIRTALIYKPNRVTALGLAASSSDAVFSRPPIAETFSYKDNRFTVIVNHFKSKGSCPSSPADANADFGQGCWNLLRTEQAQALVEFVDERRAASGDEDVVLLGDYNAYLAEEPIAVLEASGLINQDRLVPAAERYSYVFNGESGTLDYAFTTPGLNVSGRSIWHINADEPIIFDYNTEFNPPSLFSPGAFRSSDHDPVLIGLELPASLEVLYEELGGLTQQLSLTPARRAVLLVTLELSRAAERLASELETRAPRLAAASRRAARRQITEYKRLVERFVGQGQLSAAAAAPLLELAAEIEAELE